MEESSRAPGQRTPQKPRGPGRPSFAIAPPGTVDKPPNDASAYDSITLDRALRTIADDVEKAVTAYEVRNIDVGHFTDSYDKEKSAGDGIRVRLIAMLRQPGIAHHEKASPALTGDFRVAAATLEGSDSKAEIPAAKIDFKVVDKKAGKVLLDSNGPREGTQPGFVTDPADVAALAGLNVEMDLTDARKSRAILLEAIENDAKTKSVVLENSMVRPMTGSKFAVQILKARRIGNTEPPIGSYQPVPPVLRDGVPYVEIDPKDLFAINVLNDHDFDTTVSLTIDGINTMEYSEERSGLSNYWILISRRSSSIVGWHRKALEFDVFQCDQFPNHERGRAVPFASPIGQIGVEFRAFWSEFSERPLDEPAQTGNGAYHTIQGPPDSKLEHQIHSFVGKFRAAVTIRFRRDERIE